ncbi:hypothetical protein WJX72_008608 [[Myrmecia] bisecta]|uniref:Uncharacterized protein n=1 Tax=[Myrmecia] bisecta TaxID=41462 RepID=A0AAW1R8P4_9CHLO
MAARGADGGPASNASEWEEAKTGDTLAWDADGTSTPETLTGEAAFAALTPRQQYRAAYFARRAIRVAKRPAGETAADRSRQRWQKMQAEMRKQQLKDKFRKRGKDDWRLQRLHKNLGKAHPPLADTWCETAKHVYEDLTRREQSQMLMLSQRWISPKTLRARVERALAKPEVMPGVPGPRWKRPAKHNHQGATAPPIRNEGEEADGVGPQNSHVDSATM